MSLMNFRVLSLSVAQTLGYGMLYYTFTVLAAVWSTQRGWALYETQFALTLGLIAQSLGAPIVGFLVDQGRGRETMAASLLVGSCLLFCVTMTETLLQFYLVWVLIGVCWGAGLYDVCFAHLIRSRGQEARGAITTVTLIAGFASTISFPLNRWMVEEHSWELALMIQAGLGVLVMVPLAWFGAGQYQASGIPGEEELASPALSGKPQPMLNGLSISLLSVGFALFASSHYGFLANIFPIFSAWGLEGSTATWVGMLLGPMQVVGRMLLLTAPSAIAMFRVTLICTLTLLVGFMILTASTYFSVSGAALIWVMLVFVTLDGASNGVESIAKPLTIAELLGKDNIGRASGIIALPTGLMVAASPTVIAYLSQSAGAGAMLAFVSGGLVVALGAFILAKRSV